MREPEADDDEGVFDDFGKILIGARKASVADALVSHLATWPVSSIF